LAISIPYLHVFFHLKRSDSETNRAVIRLVPPEPPRLLGGQHYYHHHQNQNQTLNEDDIYSRTPLPTHPAHILLPSIGKSHGYGSVYGYSPAKEKGTTGITGTSTGSVSVASPSGFQPSSKANQLTGSGGGSSVSTTHQAAQTVDSATGSSSPPNPNPKPLPKKRLAVKVGDKKTFFLVPHDGPQSPVDGPSLSTKSSLSSLTHVESRSNSNVSCEPISEPSTSTAAPTTPAPKGKDPILTDPAIGGSPWNYQFVGGLRKVAKSPDLKEKAATSPLDSPLPPLPSLPETSDGAEAPSQELVTRPSFRSTLTTTTTSENSNYKVYRDISPSRSNTALVPPSTSDSNYEILGESTPSSVIHRPLTGTSENDENYASSVLHRPQTGTSENENYELHNESSPAVSYVSLVPYSHSYSQESLVIPPLKPRAKRSNENFGYYKSRSRDSLRTGSLTSISTILSQQEAYQAIVGSGSIIQLPILSQKARGLSSWAELSGKHPQRSHMQEHPHQWSSQLSTVLSESEGGTDRGSRSWSDDTGRRSSGFPSRQSRRMLSISSSLAQEEAASRSISDPIESPRAAFSRNGQQRNYENRLIEDQDEHGDGITDMRDLRQRPSRTRLSGFSSLTSSNEGRTSTMRSTASSRANSLLASSIPTWAKLYYGSGERRYLGAPGSSTEGSSESRNNSLLSRSPSTEGFPLSIYSPRRRPRETRQQGGRRSTRNSLEITPAQQLDDEGRVIEDYPRQHRTWSLLSSVWSPHLRTDRRATRHSLWEPPSVNWSTEGGWFGRRNVQILMFVMGFIFPFGSSFPPPSPPTFSCCLS